MGHVLSKRDDWSGGVETTGREGWKLALDRKLVLHRQLVLHRKLILLEADLVGSARTSAKTRRWGNALLVRTSDAYGIGGRVGGRVARVDLLGLPFQCQGSLSP